MKSLLALCALQRATPCMAGRPIGTSSRSESLNSTAQSLHQSRADDVLTVRPVANATAFAKRPEDYEIRTLDSEQDQAKDRQKVRALDDFLEA